MAVLLSVVISASGLIVRALLFGWALPIVAGIVLVEGKDGLQVGLRGPIVRIYPIRVYADTSVFGGAFDDEFRETSEAFFAQAREGRFGLVTSVVVRQELAPAPEQVREFFEATTEGLRVVELSQEAIELQRAYLAHAVVSARRGPDALHIALATCSACPLVVSWNFRHHVHVDKIRMYNAVNALMGYSQIDIRTPGEVVRHEEEL